MRWVGGSSIRPPGRSRVDSARSVPAAQVPVVSDPEDREVRVASRDRVAADVTAAPAAVVRAATVAGRAAVEDLRSRAAAADRVFIPPP